MTGFAPLLLLDEVVAHLDPRAARGALRRAVRAWRAGLDDRRRPGRVRRYCRPRASLRGARRRGGTGADAVPLASAHVLLIRISDQLFRKQEPSPGDAFTHMQETGMRHGRTDAAIERGQAGTIRAFDEPRAELDRIEIIAAAPCSVQPAGSRATSRHSVICAASTRARTNCRGTNERLELRRAVRAAGVRKHPNSGASACASLSRPMTCRRSSEVDHGQSFRLVAVEGRDRLLRGHLRQQHVVGVVQNVAQRSGGAELGRVRFRARSPCRHSGRPHPPR